MGKKEESAMKFDIAATMPAPETIRVRAIEPGYCSSIDPGQVGKGDIWREMGDVFTLGPRQYAVVDEQAGKPVLDELGRLKTAVLTAQEQFSAKWMEVVADDEPGRLTTAQDSLNRQLSELHQRGRIDG